MFPLYKIAHIYYNLKEVIDMKRILSLFLIPALLLAAFCACGKRSAADIGEEKTSVAVQNGEKQEAAHLTDQDYVKQMDHFDKDGNLVYVEEYKYDADGAVTAYVYRDKDGNLIARYDIDAGQFYNKAGLQITEDAFLEKLRALGADV